MRKGRVHIFIGPAGLTQPMANGGAVDAHCQGIIQESDRVSNPASQIQAICEIGEQVGIVRIVPKRLQVAAQIMRRVAPLPEKPVQGALAVAKGGLGSNLAPLGTGRSIYTAAIEIKTAKIYRDLGRH